MHLVLEYALVDDYLDRRPPLREEHLGLARAAHERGELVMAGAFSDPADTALLVFSGEDATTAEQFARADPYVANGLVTRWRVREWTTVVGDGAEMPIRIP
jgi:uncharacterized protein YciI